jgi:hypothetical protein
MDFAGVLIIEINARSYLIHNCMKLIKAVFKSTGAFPRRTDYFAL